MAVGKGQLAILPYYFFTVSDDTSQDFSSCDSTFVTLLPTCYEAPGIPPERYTYSSLHNQVIPEFLCSPYQHRSFYLKTVKSLKLPVIIYLFLTFYLSCFLSTVCQLPFANCPLHFCQLSFPICQLPFAFCQLFNIIMLT